MPTLQRGRKAISPPIEIGEVRILTRGDLSVLAEPRPVNSIQTLRDNHHRVARALASGMKNVDVAAACGMSVGRVWTLSQDPAVKDLVAHYRGLLTAEWIAAGDPVVDYLKNNALKAAAMLSDKLDAAMENNEFLPTRDLVAIQEVGFDRTGYGKVNKNVNINVDFAAQLEAARKRSAAARAPRQIEARPVPQSPSDGGSPPVASHRAASPLRRI